MCELTQVHTHMHKEDEGQPSDSLHLPQMCSGLWISYPGNTEPLLSSALLRSTEERASFCCHRMLKNKKFFCLPLDLPVRHLQGLTGQNTAEAEADGKQDKDSLCAPRGSYGDHTEAEFSITVETSGLGTDFWPVRHGR